ncbi:hypothetical protein G5714_004423 [Onychostoma macrolepis]|uniref:C-type lectin domain-containing protein n=1 Tax=Onychostoma macrolepis TaxID=369639 RepID=A0A7J6D4P6_9TELE|nr:hypothetical protein G5714_004423 [Onychostoma macrolepis]
MSVRVSDGGGEGEEENCPDIEKRQLRVIFVSEAHRNTAGEEKACLLQRVDHKEIQRRVMNVVKRASTAEVWLGLHNYCSMNMWLWLSGEIVCYQNWAPGNGTTPENCSLEKRKGAVQSGGDQRWISLPESHKLNFICSRN